MCEKCDGEFDNINEVKENEKNCGKDKINEEVIKEEKNKKDRKD
jgi:hypothetical protein